jgi:hypothetical protein
MNYPSLANDITFVVLALISTFSLLSEHLLLATVFFIIAIAFIIFEHQIVDYIKTA